MGRAFWGHCLKTEFALTQRAAITEIYGREGLIDIDPM